MQSWFCRQRASFIRWIGVRDALFLRVPCPSLLPRNDVVQGLESGLALAVGDSLGVSVVWLWQLLELPSSGAKLRTAYARE